MIEDWAPKAEIIEEVAKKKSKRVMSFDENSDDKDDSVANKEDFTEEQDLKNADGHDAAKLELLQSKQMHKMEQDLLKNEIEGMLSDLISEKSKKK